MGPQDSNPAGGTSLRNFGNSVYPTLPVSFVGPFYCFYARGSKISHTEGKCVTCRGLHNFEINHSYVSPRIGCLENNYLRPKDLLHSQPDTNGFNVSYGGRVCNYHPWFGIYSKCKSNKHGGTLLDNSEPFRRLQKTLLIMS